MGWLTRKAIGLATVTLHVTQHTDDAGVVHIDIDQTATGGIKGTTEKRALDGVPRPHEDHIFGSIVGRSQFCPKSKVGVDVPEAHLSEDDKKWLVEGWGEEFAADDVKVMENYVVNEKSQWVAWAVWGFDVVGDDKKRRYVRHTIVKSTKTGESKKLLLIYDYLGAE